MEIRKIEGGGHSMNYPKNNLNPNMTMNRMKTYIENKLAKINKHYLDRLPDINRANAAVTEAKRVQDIALQDDPDLSAAEVINRRNNAFQALEIAELEALRATQAFDRASHSAESEMLGLLEEIGARLLKLSEQNEAKALQRVKEIIGSEDSFWRLKYSHNIESLARNVDAAREPRGEFEAIRHFRTSSAQRSFGIEEILGRIQKASDVFTKHEAFAA